MHPRIAAILEYVDPGDAVLDIGCVQHDAENAKQENWLHGALCSMVDDVTGIDILDEEIVKLQEQGYDVKCQSAETFEFDREFDTIVAGEVIEHMSNPGLFLDQAKRHLAPSGSVVLTTPNPWTIHRFRRVLAGHRPYTNDEHTMWFSIDMLGELGRRSKLELSSAAYVPPNVKRAVSTANQNGVSLTKAMWELGFEQFGSSTFLVVFRHGKN